MSNDCIAYIINVQDLLPLSPWPLKICLQNDTKKIIVYKCDISWTQKIHIVKSINSQAGYYVKTSSIHWNIALKLID